MMKPVRKLLAGLAAATLIPLGAAIFILRPTPGYGLIMIGCGILAVLAAWRMLESTLPATFSEWRKKGGPPERYVDRLLAPIEEFINGIQASKFSKQDDELRQKLHHRLDGLARRRNLLPAGGEIKEITVLISDLRGFTIITDIYPASDVILLLNRYFTRMTEIITRYGGTVDKFVGDSIMALFIASVEHPRAPERAVCCAAEMQIAMDQVNRENEQMGMPKIYMGIGLNTGRMVAGKIGSDLHCEYTVIGKEVNLASRIEAATLRGQILLSESTYAQTENIVLAKEPFSTSVKGRKDPLRLYELVNVKAPYNLKVPEREVRRYPRADVDIPFQFQICEGKVVISDVHNGRVRDISAGGMRAVTSSEVAPHFNIKFMLKSEALGVYSHDIYAKILKVSPEEDLVAMNLEFTVIDPKDIGAIKKMVHKINSEDF
ncbi:MAG: PilZ domain-containing protein [Desulfobacterales bacterium]|nr:PilZ domain-containing protein [Desulfobacterales bacterium]